MTRRRFTWSWQDYKRQYGKAAADAAEPVAATSVSVTDPEPEPAAEPEAVPVVTPAPSAPAVAPIAPPPRVVRRALPPSGLARDLARAVMYLRSERFVVERSRDRPGFWRIGDADGYDQAGVIAFAARMREGAGRRA